MQFRRLQFAIQHLLVFACVAACTAADRNHAVDGGDPSPDGSSDVPQPDPNERDCSPNAPLRCEATTLVRCSNDGATEVSESCSLGCIAAELRCADVAPSNGLAALLDLTSGQSDLDLGESATIDADTGVVTVDGSAVSVRSETLPQSGAPTIRVLVVRSLTTKAVVVTGNNALAIVSNGDITIRGVFEASAKADIPGAGALTDGRCRGGNIRNDGRNITGGAGGGGFGSVGGAGGKAADSSGTMDGGAGGSATGNESLIPLRGGCAGGGLASGETVFGRGGGAMQLVSRTQIAVTGILAANGSSWYYGGGSGGGILLEAPAVEVTGGVVANGGAGSGCYPGQDGQLNGSGAKGGEGCSLYSHRSNGGNGGARDAPAQPGETALPHYYAALHGGGGGGGVGRIRVNTSPGGLRSPGLFSPVPSEAMIGLR